MNENKTIVIALASIFVIVIVVGGIFMGNKLSIERDLVASGAVPIRSESEIIGSWELIRYEENGVVLESEQLVVRGQNTMFDFSSGGLVFVNDHLNGFWPAGYRIKDGMVVMKDADGNGIQFKKVDDLLVGESIGEYSGKQFTLRRIEPS